MTAEVQDLLSCAILDTSSQESGDSTPKRPTSAALEARMEDSSKLVATFLRPHHGQPCLMTLCLFATHPPWPQQWKLLGRPASLPHCLTKTSTGDDIGTLPEEVLHLQVEMNRIMGQLLTTRVSMDAHQRKEVSNFQMALHQNEAQTTKIIKEAETVCATTIREAKAHCANIIQDAEATCARTIREAETASTKHALLCSKLTGTVWRAWKGRPLKRRRSKTTNLSCLQDSPTYLPPGSPWGTDVPSPVTNGEHVFGHPFGHSSPGIYCQGGTYPCDLPSGYSCSTCTLLRNKWQCHLPNLVACSLGWEDEVMVTSEVQSHSSRKTGCL